MGQSVTRISRVGYVYALISAVTAGLIPIFSKLLIVTIAPLTIAAVVFIVSGFLLIPYRTKELPSKVSIKWLVATGFAGAALAPALYMFGIGLTSAVNASLLTNAEVFFTGVLAVLLFRERLSRTQLYESLLIVAGVVVVSTNLNASGVQLVQGVSGNLLILGASFVWAVDNNLSRITSQRFGPIFVSKYRNMVGGAILLGFILATAGSLSVPLASVPLLLLYALDALVATLTFMGALVNIGAVRTLLVVSTTTIFGPLFAIAVLGELVTLVQVAGGALILLGVFLIQRSEGS